MQNWGGACEDVNVQKCISCLSLVLHMHYDANLRYICGVIF